jgi:beta-glucosidase
MNARNLSVLVLLCASCFSGNAQTPQETNADAAKRAESYLNRMSLEERIDYIGGIGFAVRPLPTLQLPALEMSDGPFGVRSNRRFPSTTYAIGIGLAATWDQDLAARVGSAIGKDARARGVLLMLGSGVNIYRSRGNVSLPAPINLGVEQ